MKLINTYYDDSFLSIDQRKLINFSDIKVDIITNFIIEVLKNENILANSSLKLYNEIIETVKKQNYYEYDDYVIFVENEYKEYKLYKRIK